MALKDKWQDLVDGVSEAKVQPINDIAKSVIELEETTQELKNQYDEFEDGATFIPSVSEDGVLSWTNDGGLKNPAPINLVSLVLNEMEQAEDFTYGG